MLGPFVDSPLQKRHGHPGASPEKGEMRANVQKLKHMKFHLSIGKRFFFPPMRSNIGADYPGRL